MAIKRRAPEQHTESGPALRQDEDVLYMQIFENFYRHALDVMEFFRSEKERDPRLKTLLEPIFRHVYEVEQTVGIRLHVIGVRNFPVSADSEE
jgi:hypothetical protein